MDDVTAKLDAWNAGLADPLRKTIDFVRREIPHYRAILDDVEDGSASALLLQLPVLTKSSAIRNKERLRLTSDHKRIGRFSTGTTRRGDRYLDVQRIQAEAFAVQVYLITGDWSAARTSTNWNDAAVEALGREHGRGEREGRAVATLHVESMHYEAWPTNVQPHVTPVAWSHHANTIQSLYQLLAIPKEEDGFRILRVESGPLVKMTMLLEARGLDVAATAIDTIGVYGYLTPRWRRWLETRWAARIVEVYSMSEFRSVARECVAGGHFHFDELPLVTEVLHPVSGLHVADGRGELVLTSLYPFAQQQPLLRYTTGDLVQIVECTRSGRLGFRWEGRLAHARPTDDGGLAGERFWMDALDALPDVARSADSFEQLGLLTDGSLGWPCFWMTNRGEVHVRLRYRPELFVDRIRAIEADLLDRAPEASIVWHGPDHTDDAIDEWYAYVRPLYPFSTLLG